MAPPSLESIAGQLQNVMENMEELREQQNEHINELIDFLNDIQHNQWVMMGMTDLIQWIQRHMMEWLEWIEGRIDHLEHHAYEGMCPLDPLSVGYYYFSIVL